VLDIVHNFVNNLGRSVYSLRLRCATGVRKSAVALDEDGVEDDRRSGAPPDRITQRVLAVCDSVGAFIEAWGFKAIHGKIWALLALRREPTPQTEVAEILGVSRSLISTAVSELVQYGLVRAIGDHRNAPYEARLDVWPTISDVLRSREWMLIERARLALEAALEEAEFCEESGQRTPYDLRRIRLVLAMTELAQTVLKLFLSLRVPRSLDGFGEWIQDAVSFVKKLKLFR
jgi:HTH-type transcriptional regulator, glycine betaine synthesis regulator